MIRSTSFVLFAIFIAVGTAACVAESIGEVANKFTGTPVISTLPDDEISHNQAAGSETPTVKALDADGESLVSTPEVSSTCQDPFSDVNIKFRASGWNTNFCKHSVPLDEIISGGPSRDVIPPLDEPKFESVRQATEWLDDQEPVMWLEINGDFRAYPLQILIWHEIVNDVVGEVPVVVTFCPLCNASMVFQRPIINDDLLNFGTSGNLRKSDLVMWDRQTESWWQQFIGEAIVGDLTGTQLKLLPSTILSWEDFKTKYPDGKVLSRDTGYLRDYGTNPYPGYDNINQFPFLFDGQVDDRYLPMTRVLGVEVGGVNKAFVYDLLVENKVLNHRLGGEAIVVFWKAGTNSAVDTSSIAEGRDVGTTGVFLRNVSDQELTFTANKDGTFEDNETSSTWDILGTAMAGPLQGENLMALAHYDTFWFVWAAFVPEGSVLD